MRAAEHEGRQALVEAALAAFVPQSERERASLGRFRAELGRLREPFSRDADPVHVTASAVILGSRGTVLHLHKRLRRWLQPGGHIEQGEQPSAAALREATEETGLSLRHPAEGPLLFHLDVHPAGDHLHLDLRYLLWAEDAEPQPHAGESPTARWFSFAEALAIADDGLIDALRRAQELAAGTGRSPAGDAARARGRLPADQREHNAHTRAAYDALARVWSETTDDGPYNGWLERPALRALVPPALSGQRLLEAACGSGTQVAWLREKGAQVVGFDLSVAMALEARRRVGGAFVVADLAEPLPFPDGAFDGITCSLALHYVEVLEIPFASFARLLRPGGWLVTSLDHPFAPPLASQRGGYFDTELVTDTWSKGDVEVTQHFWRRPLSAVMDAAASAGLQLERVMEARPGAEALVRFPDDLGPLVDRPSFIVYRFVRRPVGLERAMGGR